MKKDPYFEKQTSDLLFEITEGSGKFLIAVCDEIRLRKTLLAEIKRELAKSGKRVAMVSLRSSHHHLYRTITSHARGKAVGVLQLLNFEDLPSGLLMKAFGDLNFHRDALGALSVPIVIWLAGKLLPRMITHAPDLWSRRGAVYHFSQSTPSSFIKRLFSQVSAESKSWKPEPTLSKAFKSIFTAEKALRQCLKDRKSFSLSKADGLITKIHSALDSLVSECERGRQIEVAFWLWNFSHLDGDLQSVLDQLEPSQRIRYESLYTDRNEALLYLSKKIPSLLSRYRDALGENIKSKTRISLLARSRDVAMSQISRMARELGSPGALHLPFDRDSELFFAGLPALTRSPDSLFLQKAARELEEWLAGVSKTTPTFLSEEESGLLKLLYQNPGNERVVAALSRMPLGVVRKKLKALERKVSLFLGVVS